MKDSPAACSRSTPPAAPFPPANLGEPLTALGWAPGSKLHAQPHPSSPKRARGAGPASAPLPAKGLPRPRPPSTATTATTASHLSSCVTEPCFLGKTTPNQHAGQRERDVQGETGADLSPWLHVPGTLRSPVGPPGQRTTKPWFRWLVEVQLIPAQSKP